MPVVQPNSLIVVTGVTGYIASHVALLLLREGHRVRGTVRPSSLTKAEALKTAFVDQGLERDIVETRLEFFAVENEDFFSEDIWLRAFKDADGVEHVAYPIDTGLDRGIVDRGINSTLTLLRAASKIPSIKRFVFTSSSAAAHMQPRYREEAITVQDYSDDAIKVVYEGESIENYPHLKDSGLLLPYAASKALSEKAAWDFVEKEKPNFDFVSVLPGSTFGPVLFGAPSLTPNVVIASYNNDIFFKGIILPQWGVDVRDVAKLHYLGLVSNETAGKRWFALVHPWGPNSLFAVLRKHFPDATIPEDWEGGEVDRQKWDNSASNALLGGEWISFEKSVLDTVASVKKA